MPFEPPAAKPDLDKEHDKTEQQAGRITRYGRQVKPDREIEERAEERLRDIVAEAHLAIDTQCADPFPEAVPLIECHERGDKHERKGELLPHIERRACRLANDLLVAKHDLFLQGIQWREDDGGDNQYLYPKTLIRRRGEEKLFSADIETEQEQAGSLHIASGIDGPQQAGFLSKRDVLPDKVPQVTLARVGRCLGIHLGDTKIGQLMGDVDPARYEMVPFDGLEQEKECPDEQHTVACLPEKEKDDPDQGIEQQHVARWIEGGVERSEGHEQKHAPEEPIAEILAPAPLVLVLDEKGESEEQGENGIGLPGEKSESGMKDAKIHDLEPTGRAGGIDGIDKMFYVVDEQDRQDGEAPESVNNLDPGRWRGQVCRVFHDNCFKIDFAVLREDRLFLS